MPKENRVAFNKKVRNGFHYYSNDRRFQYSIVTLHIYIYPFGVINIYQWNDLHSCDRFNKKPLHRLTSFYDTISTDLVIYASHRWKPTSKQPRRLKINGVCSIETRNKIKSTRKSRLNVVSSPIVLVLYNGLACISRLKHIRGV